MYRKHFLIFPVVILVLTFPQLVTAGEPFAIARLKYNGGGDWYGDPGSLANLQAFIREHSSLETAEKEKVVSITADDFFSYPYLYMTGHGEEGRNVLHFTDQEAQRLREHLLGGGFLHCDDNYGFDTSFRREMKKVFPEESWVEVPFNHPIYHIAFDFPNGLPKIHEHDGQPPQGLAIMVDGRIVVFYTYQSDLGDGWEDSDVHNDPPEKRRAALRMGTNIVLYALSGRPRQLP
ncbi:DUF4159 domain-containing protein [bacterium]|nr:DUF4159 domain-containing protein [bacterium]